MSFDANSRSIMHLFREPENITYKIPKYQRAYSWTEEEVTSFCDDLANIIDKNIEDYFWGAIITIKDKRDKNVQEVVDGQQRITTFTILIAQLYNLCEEVLYEINEHKSTVKGKDKIKLKKIEDIINNKKSDLAQCIRYNGNYKLTLSETDKEYFKNMIGISNEAELRETSISIIDEIEKDKSIEISDSDLEKFTRVLKKDIYKIEKIPNNILYEKFKQVYIEKYKPMNNYDRIEIEKQLLIKYINDRICIEEIKSYIEYEDEKDYENIIQFLTIKDSRDEIDSHKNLRKSWEIINNRIIKPIININDINNKCDKLNLIIDKFITKTQVVLISPDSEENAYMMFQVLNDRGRALGTIELLRPYTLQRLEKNTDKMKKCGEYWDKISEDKDCEKYLKNYLSSYIHVSDKEKKLHNKYKNQFFKEEFTDEQVFNNIKKIYDMKIIYEKLLDGQWPYENSKTNIWKKNRLYQIIKLLEYKKTIPLLIAIYEESDNEEDFAYAIDIIERTVFRYITICEKRATNLTNTYSEIISETRSNGKFPREVFKSKMKKLLEEDGCDLETFKQKIDSKKLMYTKNNTKKIKYFLSTIEYYRSDYESNDKKNVLDNPSKSKILNDNIIEIEHIYAQNIEKKEEDMECIKHNIGNLTLLEKELNIKNSNKPFVDKKDGYNSEQIIITKELKDLEQWNLETYNDRLKFYQDIASKIYVIE